MRSVSGEQLIFSNTDLLTSRIRNFKRMEKRRVVFSLGIAYETLYDKLAAIPHMIREIIELRENVQFDQPTSRNSEIFPSILRWSTMYWFPISPST